MKEILIEVPSYWKIIIKNEYIDQDSDTLVIILPGNRYTNMAPMLYYSFNAALQVGYDILVLNYGFQKVDSELKVFEREYVIFELKEAIRKTFDIKNTYKKIIFIGKSMGTAIQHQLIHEFQNHIQKHIFLTPIPECIEGIKESDSLVIVGAKDPFFRQEHIAMIRDIDNIKLHVIEKADHSLDTEDYIESIDILKKVISEIYSFINS